MGGYREYVSGQFSDFRDRLLAVDQTTYLQSLLVRQDKMAMASSVEARVPFVHLPLVNIVNRIPNNLKIPGGITKPILKIIAEKYFPNNFINRRKVGLLLPYDEWCDDPKALGRYLDYLTESNSELSQFSEKNKLKLAVDKFRAGSKPERSHMMSLINLELWMRELKNEQLQFNLHSYE